MFKRVIREKKQYQRNFEIEIKYHLIVLFPKIFLFCTWLVCCEGNSFKSFSSELR